MYKVCSPTSCEFAFKHIRNIDEVPIEMLHAEVKHEAHMHKLAADAGIAPEIIQVILDENSGAIIMQKLSDSMKMRYDALVWEKNEKEIPHPERN
jgi:hypothetical protein